MIVAIEIKNPAAVAHQFGECAGDFTANECKWWVGTTSCLHPSPSLPEGARVIHAPVQFSGGSAWISHPPRRPASPAAEENPYRRLVRSFGGLVASGHVARAFRFGGVRGAALELGKLRAAPAPVLP